LRTRTKNKRRAVSETKDHYFERQLDVRKAGAKEGTGLGVVSRRKRLRENLEEKKEKCPIREGGLGRQEVRHCRQGSCKKRGFQYEGKCAKTYQ